MLYYNSYFTSYITILLVDSDEYRIKQESPANAKGTRDSSACMKAHCEQMQNP